MREGGAVLTDGVGVLILLALVVVLPCAALMVRRGLLGHRGGTVEVSMRLRSSSNDSGWAAGVARFTGDELQWFRLFSLSPRPRARLSRNDLAIAERRRPRPGELASLNANVIVLHCLAEGTGASELAMSETALTGFQSWLEAMPPGRTHRSVSGS